MKFLLLLLFSLGVARATGNLTEDQGANELQKELNSLNKQAEDVLQKVDQLNPGNLPAMPGLPGLVPGANGAPQLDEMQMRAFKLVTDQKFMAAANEVIKSDKRKKLLQYQICFFIFMIFFKSWRQGVVKNWFRRALEGLACTVLTVVGVSYVIPVAMIGPAYALVMKTIWNVMVLGR